MMPHSEKAARYPSEHETDVLLKDGSTVHVRPIRPEDDAAMIEAFSRLSQRTIYLRFHHAVKGMTKQGVRQYTHVDYHDRFALVATVGEADTEQIIAVGRYSRRSDPSRAGVAFVVDDTHQGRGIATQLLERLAVVARGKGIETFEADVLAENRAMMDVLRESGFPMETKFEYATIHVTFPIEPTADEEDRIERRESVAEIASLLTFFHPRSVAVVGASRERGTISAEIFHNIVREGYSGVVYPVNPNAEVVGAIRAYPSVLDVPGDVELAIVAVPAKHVLEVIDQCAEKSVKGVIVISAGFKESGDEGAALELELLSKVRSWGIRLVGPNCMGVLNTAPDVRLNATFSPVFPPRGNVALLSQSGALGLAILDFSRKLNIGLSTFMSVGNRADVSSNDVIQFWEQDPDTDVILLYLESFGNPRKFGRLARRVSATKPIVAVKSGRTSAGSRAAASHTGALANVDIASDALFRQAGVIRADTLEQLFDVASLLAHQPPPGGRRVSILTNAGGPAILAADACEGLGLEVPPLSQPIEEALRDFLPTAAGLSNPVDLLASASADDYGRALRILLNDHTTDAVIVIFTPPLVTEPRPVAEAIRQAALESTGQKTLLACFMSAQGAPPELGSEEGGVVPSFAFPERAAAALAKVSEYTAWRKQPRGAIPKLPRVRREKGRRIVDMALRNGEPKWLPSVECFRLLAAYGIRSAKTRFARTSRAAADAAVRIGLPVALKVASPSVTHKTDLGGVMLNLQSAVAVREAFDVIRERMEEATKLSEMEGVVVQEMVEDGIEAIVGVTQDPSFGPLMMFGLGGTYVELLKDLSFRIHPLTDIDARGMVRSIRSYPLLEGWRGTEPRDVASIEELLLRISALIEDVPEILEMDLNPIKVQAPGQGCIVVDARIRIGAR
jgi:acetyl coenzyme A synthetase (ADP forming)-like protein